VGLTRGKPDQSYFPAFTLRKIFGFLGVAIDNLRLSGMILILINMAVSGLAG
jgi:hypothetical protein